VLSLSVRTFQRWIDDDQVRSDKRKEAVRPAPSNQLSNEEREQILKICHSERFKSMPPSQIVPTLTDEGIYVASESSFYRVLRAAGQQHHRGRSRKPTKKQPTSYCATAPDQIWSWDITCLNSTVRGMYYYLYMVLDIYSRRIVAWEVHIEESAEHASRMIQKACMQQKINLLERPLVLHSDNGSPMKGAC